MKVVYARTNAEFLNKTFGTAYQAWMKCGWDYNKDTIVWMTELDNKVRQGWINTIVDANTVREEYVWQESDKLDSHKYLKNYRRIIVKKEKEYGRYVILGTYRYDFQNSVERNRRIWIKISDEIV